MNVSDSERVAAVFEHLNYSAVKDADDADVIVINACSVRQTAIDRIWGLTRDLNKLRASKGVKLILTGCVLPEDGTKMTARFDLIFEIKKLGELEKFLHQKQEFTGEDYFATTPLSDAPFSRFVPIMTGCDNYCSYCAVPFVRGREQSRPVKDVLVEVNALVLAGAKEICLLGQNVNAYQFKSVSQYQEIRILPPPLPSPHQGRAYRSRSIVNFIQLLELVNDIDGLREFSFVTSHPKDASPELFQTMADLEKLKKYLHLPFQSGSNRILELMHRGYNAKHYLGLAKQYRKIVPRGVLSTDVIVGFPGESEEDFLKTKELLEEVRFNHAYIFKYSPRPNTKAEKLKDDVPKDEKERRHKILLDSQRQISRELKSKT